MDKNTFKFLLIEDDQSFARMLSIRLRTNFKGSKIRVCSSITEAREIMSNGSSVEFDLIFLDHHLPDGLGVEFLFEGVFKDCAVMVISTHDGYDLPGASIEAGAAYFLSKSQTASRLFIPLVRGLIERNIYQREARKNKIKLEVMNAVREMVAKIKHEINNPLGAVLGGAHILRIKEDLSQKDINKAVELVEASGMRIKNSMDQLAEMVSDPFDEGKGNDSLQNSEISSEAAKAEFLSKKKATNTNQFTDSLNVNSAGVKKTA